MGIVEIEDEVKALLANFEATVKKEAETVIEGVRAKVGATLKEAEPKVESEAPAEPETPAVVAPETPAETPAEATPAPEVAEAAPVTSDTPVVEAPEIPATDTPAEASPESTTETATE